MSRFRWNPLQGNLFSGVADCEVDFTKPPDPDATFDRETVERPCTGCVGESRHPHASKAR